MLKLIAVEDELSGSDCLSVMSASAFVRDSVGSFVRVSVGTSIRASVRHLSGYNVPLVVVSDASNCWGVYCNILWCICYLLVHLSEHLSGHLSIA